MAVSTKSTSKTTKNTTSTATPDATPTESTKSPDKGKGAPSGAAGEPVVKRKEMMSRVATRANLRPNQVREVYDAVLQELGDALMRGEKLRLPPLGMVKVNRIQTSPDADVVVCKIRRNKATDRPKEALAPEEKGR